MKQAPYLTTRESSSKTRLSEVTGLLRKEFIHRDLYIFLKK